MFVADAESSSVRALVTETRRAVGIAGASEETLFDFGDVDGPA